MPFAGEFIFRVRSWRRILRFAGIATAALLSPSTYQQATRELRCGRSTTRLAKSLFGYLLFTGLLSLVVIEIVLTTAGRYGLRSIRLIWFLRVLVLEVLPLLTAFFVALRSGAAIGAEIALMTVRGELQDAEEAGESPLHGELVPRIAGAALSVASLTTLSCALAVWLAYVSLYGFSAWGLDEFSEVDRARVRAADPRWVGAQVLRIRPRRRADPGRNRPRGRARTTCARRRTPCSAGWSSCSS
jgi:phospholipid/cholesterol/gamma-HCH transport system permease protein